MGWMSGMSSWFSGRMPAAVRQSSSSGHGEAPAASELDGWLLGSLLDGCVRHGFSLAVTCVPAWFQAVS